MAFLFARTGNVSVFHKKPVKNQGVYSGKCSISAVFRPKWDLTNRIGFVPSSSYGNTILVNHVPQFNYWGMSSGMVSSTFWLEKALPMLINRLREAN
jgi:hypothetical protein